MSLRDSWNKFVNDIQTEREKNKNVNQTWDVNPTGNDQNSLIVPKEEKSYDSGIISIKSDPVVQKAYEGDTSVSKQTNAQAQVKPTQYKSVEKTAQEEYTSSGTAMTDKYRDFMDRRNEVSDTASGNNPAGSSFDGIKGIDTNNLKEEPDTTAKNTIQAYNMRMQAQWDYEPVTVSSENVNQNNTWDVQPVTYENKIEPQTKAVGSTSQRYYKDAEYKTIYDKYTGRWYNIPTLYADQNGDVNRLSDSDAIKAYYANGIGLGEYNSYDEANDALKAQIKAVEEETKLKEIEKAKQKEQSTQNANHLYTKSGMDIDQAIADAFNINPTKSSLWSGNLNKMASSTVKMFADAVMNIPYSMVTTGAKWDVDPNGTEQNTSNFDVDPDTAIRQPDMRILGEAYKNSDFYKNLPTTKWDKFNDEQKAEFEEQAYENIDKGGPVARTMIDMGVSVMDAIPMALASLATSGGTLAVEGATVTGTLAMENPALVTMLDTAAKNMIKDPNYWVSFFFVVGSGYDDAKALGADDVTATLYALTNGLINAGIEVGPGGDSGIQGVLKTEAGKRAFIKSMKEEGAEEVWQGIVERGLQNLILGQDSPVFSVTDSNAVLNPVTAGKEFAGGAVAGGVLGGGNIVLNGAINNLLTPNAPTVINDNKAQAKTATNTNKTVVNKVGGRTVSGTAEFSANNIADTSSVIINAPEDIKVNGEFDKANTIVGINDDGSIVYTLVDNFNENTEPVIVKVVKQNSDWSTEDITPSTKTIISNKSTLVKDDYTGFDVAAQKERESEISHAQKLYGINYNNSKLNDAEYYDKIRAKVDAAKAKNASNTTTENVNLSQNAAENVNPGQKTVEIQPEITEQPVNVSEEIAPEKVATVRSFEQANADSRVGSIEDISGSLTADGNRYGMELANGYVFNSNGTNRGYFKTKRELIYALNHDVVKEVTNVTEQGTNGNGGIANNGLYGQTATEQGTVMAESTAEDNTTRSTVSKTEDRISPQELTGLETTSKDIRVTVVPKEKYNKVYKRAQDIAERNGVELVIFEGDNLNENGERALYWEGKVYVRGDARVSADVLTKHEVFHKLVEDGKINTNKAWSKLMSDAKTRKVLKGMFERYSYYYNAHTSGDFVSGQVIREEILADLYAGINQFESFASGSVVDEIIGNVQNLLDSEISSQSNVEGETNGENRGTEVQGTSGRVQGRPASTSNSKGNEARRSNSRRNEKNSRQLLLEDGIVDVTSTPEEFETAMKGAFDIGGENIWAVTEKTAEIIKDEKLKAYLTEDGSAGVIVAPDGDIEGVFRNLKTGQKGVTNKLIPFAIKQGGTKLDCYGPSLASLYSQLGFEPVVRIKFVDKYANKGWNLQVHGRPDIYFMMYTGEKNFYSKSDLDNLPLIDVSEDENYGLAYEYRDKKLAEFKKKGKFSTDLTENAEPFYFQSSKVLENVKDKKMSIDSVIPYLKGKGVKDEEIKWTGLEKFLKEQRGEDGKNKSVEVSALKDFFNSNEFGLEQKTFAQNEAEFVTEDGVEYKSINDWEEDVIYTHEDDSGDEFADKIVFWRNTPGKVEAYKLGSMDAYDYESLTFELEYLKQQYQNTTDEAKRKELEFEMNAILNDMDDLLSLGRLADTLIVNSPYSDGRARWKGYTIAFEYDIKDAFSDYREELFKLPKSDFSNNAMRVHFPNQEGVVVHARISDAQLPSGDNIIFIDEIQSDWHNQGFNAGYTTKERKAKFQKLYNAQRDLDSAEGLVSKIEEMKDVNPSVMDKIAKNEWYASIDTWQKVYDDTKAKILEKTSLVESLKSELYANSQEANKELEKFIELSKKDETLKAAMSKIDNAYRDDNSYSSALDIWELAGPLDASFAKERGYALTDKESSVFKEYTNKRNDLEYKIDKAKEVDNQGLNGIEDAPFKNGEYVNYALKNIIYEAARSWQDGIAWTTPEMQDKRWANGGDANSDEGLSGNLKGYKVEYEQDFKKFLNKIGKKFGIKVSETSVGKGYQTVSIDSGNELDTFVKLNNGWNPGEFTVVLDSDGEEDIYIVTNKATGEFVEVKDGATYTFKTDILVPYFKFTPEFREAIMRDGQAMFSRDFSDSFVEEFRTERQALERNIDSINEGTSSVQPDVEYVTNELFKGYNPKINKNSFKKSLREIKDYMNHAKDRVEGITYDDAKRMADTVGRSIIYNNETLTKDPGYKAYKNFLDLIDANPVKVPQNIKRNINDYMMWQQENQDNVHVSEEGISIPELYGKVQEAFGKTMFPSGLPQYKQLMRVAQVMDGFRSVYDDAFEYYFDIASTYAANDVLNYMTNGINFGTVEYSESVVQNYIDNIAQIRKGGLDRLTQALTNVDREVNSKTKAKADDTVDASYTPFNTAMDVRQANLPANEWTTTKTVNNKIKKAKSVSEITQLIEDQFGVNITEGHIRSRRILGFLMHGNMGIRTKSAGDIATIAHELGHWLDLRHSMRTKMPADAKNELIANLSPGMKRSYPQTKWHTEGLAEFVRELMLNKDFAINRYPKFSDFFFKTISSEENVKLMNLADEFNAYYVEHTTTAGSDIVLKSDGNPDFRTLKDRTKDWSENLYQKMVDSLHGIALLDKKAGTDIYRLATNASYADNRAWATITGNLYDIDGNYVGHGLKTSLDGINVNNKEEYKDFGEYLICKHGPEFKRETNGDVFANPINNNDTWMENRAKELEQKYPEFEKAAQRLYDFQQQFLETYLVDTGLLADETAQEWAQRWKYYVPFNRQMNKYKGVTYANGRSGFANQTDTIHKAHGDTRPIIHPVDSIVDNICRMTNAGIKNGVMRELISQAKAYKVDATFMEEVPKGIQSKHIRESQLKDALKHRADVKWRRGEISDTAWNDIYDFIGGLTESQFQQFDEAGVKYNTVTVRIDGKDEMWNINDPLLFESLTNLTPKKAGAILEAYGRVSKFMTSNITGNNIIWSLSRNMPKDFITAMNYSPTKNPFKVIAGIGSSYWNNIKNVINNDFADPLFQEYLAMGGGKSSAYTSDINLAERAKKEWNKSNVGATIFTKWLNPIRQIEFVSDTVEMGPRYAVYKAMRKQGMSPQDAFYEACDVTVNFRRGGTISKEINKAIPFFNANVQGIDKFQRYYSGEGLKGQARAKAVASRLSFFVATSAIMAAFTIALNYRDKDKEKEYEQLSNYTKNNYWLIPLEGYKDYKAGQYLALPKARELGLLSSFMERLYEYYKGDNDHSLDEFANYFNDNMLPAIASEIVNTAEGLIGTNDPQQVINDELYPIMGNFGAFGIAYYIGSNKDFLGRAIVPESYQDLFGKEQYKQSTSKLAYYIGQVTGLSPLQIDYVGEQMFSAYWKPIKALAPMDEYYKDKTLGVKNSWIKDNQYSLDVINWLYDNAEFSDKVVKSKDVTFDDKVRNKFDNAIKSFYSTYYNLTKEVKETDASRKLRQDVIDMVDSYRDTVDGDYYTKQQQKAVDVAKKVNDTSVLPSTMSSTIKDGDDREVALTAQQYYDYQTKYNAYYYQGLDAVSAFPDVDSVATYMSKLKTTAKEVATNDMLKQLGKKQTKGATEMFNASSVSEIITTTISNPLYKSAGKYTNPDGEEVDIQKRIYEKAYGLATGSTADSVVKIRETAKAVGISESEMLEFELYLDKFDKPTEKTKKTAGGKMGSYNNSEVGKALTSFGNTKGLTRDQKRTIWFKYASSPTEANFRANVR